MYLSIPSKGTLLDLLPAPPQPLCDDVPLHCQDLILKVVAPKLPGHEICSLEPEAPQRREKAPPLQPRFDMDLEMIYGADQSNPYRLQVSADAVRVCDCILGS